MKFAVHTLTVGFLLSFSLSAMSQNTSSTWYQDTNESAMRLAPNAKRYIKASHYRVLQISVADLKNKLNSPSAVLDFPLPDGNFEKFDVAYSPVMADELAKKYPSIRTYAGQSVRNPSHSIRFDITPKGFHAMLYLNDETVFIDPYSDSDILNYICYYKKDFLLQKATYPCQLESKEEEKLPLDHSQLSGNPTNSRTEESFGCNAPLQLRTYRLAVSCTGEYAQFHYAGIPADSIDARRAAVLSAIVTSVNRVNSVYERDLAVHFNLIANNDVLIFLSGATDPYTNDNSGALIGQSQTVITNTIGNANFDVGHTFSTGGGGLASLGVICQDGQKASGITGTDSPIGDPYDIDYVAHELGHQFGGDHTFNSNTGSCTTNRVGNVAYEVGSGVTIMAYAGICAPQDLAPHSIDNFHAASLNQMLTYINNAEGNTCPVKTGSNIAPQINSGITANLFIPKKTPFVLDATASDINGDTITYCWEQWDLGAAGNINAASTTAPIFRPFSPTTDSYRYFPKLSDILSNTTTYGEVLPAVARKLKFRLTVRDNRLGATGGGGVCWADYQLNVSGTAGPFVVTNPNNGTEIWRANNYEKVVWDVAKTDLAPVNCKLVNIKLSIDGGQTYPFTLASNIANDGSEYVLAPDTVSTLARVRVEAVGNIFLDVSDKNFNIKKPTSPNYGLGISPSFKQICLPAADTIVLNTVSLLGYDSLVMFSVLSGLPDGATANFVRNPVLPSENTQLTLDYGNINSSSLDTLVLQAIAAGGDTLLRTVVLKIIANDFSALQTFQPANNESGVAQLPVFKWRKTPNANFYEIQIATNPSFDAASIVKNVSNLLDTTYTITTLLDISKLYFWRVRPVNECGQGAFTDIATFYTKLFACAKYASQNVPLAISPSGTPTIESTVIVTAGGIIGDVNVSKFKGSHEFFKDLDARLISPAGTEVKLFASVCGNTNGNFDCIFDDQAASVITCPLNNLKQVQPQQALSAFNGENSTGTWKLRIKDQVGTSGGELSAWELQLCGNVIVNPPVLVKNDTLAVAPSKDRYVSSDFLLVTDANNSPNQLTYTVVRAPKYGQLFPTGSLQPLVAGAKFTQGNINSNQIRYKHDGSNNNDFDSFLFVVEDGEGGWIGTTQFNIKMDINAPVSTSETDNLADRFYLYPNPSSQEFQISWEWSSEPKQMSATVFNLQGQILENVTLVEKNHTFKTDKLPSGIYLMKIQTERTSFVKKIVVER